MEKADVSYEYEHCELWTVSELALQLFTFIPLDNFKLNEHKVRFLSSVKRCKWACVNLQYISD